MDGGYIYTHGCQGPGGGRHAWTHVSTLLWTPLFSHRGVNTQTHGDSCKHKEDPRIYCATYTSVVNLYVRGKKRGWLSTRACGSIMR